MSPTAALCAMLQEPELPETLDTTNQLHQGSSPRLPLPLQAL